MRIESSVIGMESARRYQSFTTRSEGFRLQDDSRKQSRNDSYLLQNNMNQEDVMELDEKASKGGEAKLSEWEERFAKIRQANVKIYESRSDVETQFHNYAVRYIFMLLFGERGKSMFDEVRNIEDAGTAENGNTATLEFTPMKQITLTGERYFEETENVCFKSQGKVTTADGREIAFGLELGMSRSFREYYREEYNVANLQRVCDPLVIHFDGNLTTLSDQKFFFDIDADGEEDEIYRLASGSGYLALDQNGDGIINDGSELFGPQSGDGFSDLAKYDEDGNGWIDENDSVFHKLRIWCQNEKGENELYTLAQKGVGAICLQKAETNFSLKDAKNQEKGFIRSTGIFLYEDGNVGSIQHLDLAQ